MTRIYTNKIVVHHSVTPQNWGKVKTVNAIERSHKLRGLLAGQGKAAYHVLLGYNWQVLVRPESSVGYHSGNWLVNRTSVAVCLIGNFNTDKLTKYQEKKLSDQLNNWRNKYNIKKILLHRDIKNTSCPGKSITHEYVNTLLKKKDLLPLVNKAFRKTFGRNPWTKESHYWQKRVTAKNPFRKIGTYKVLLNKMAYYKSRGKTKGY